MKIPINVILVFLFSFSFSCLKAQTTDFEKIPYKFGKFEGDVPAGEKFYITGPLINMDKPPADVVILNIYKVKRKSKDIEEENCPHYTGYYWKPKDETSNQFQIFMDRPLLFSRTYKFEFQYFSSAESAAGQNILATFTKKLEARFEDEEPEIDEADLITLLNDVNTNLKEQNKNFCSLGFYPNNNCTDKRQTFQLRTELQLISFPINTENGDVSAESLADLIQDSYFVKYHQGKIDTYKAQVAEKKEEDKVKAAITTLEEHFNNTVSKKFDELKDYISSAQEQPSDDTNVNPNFSTLYTILVTAGKKDERSSLSSYVSAISKLKKSKIDLKRYEKEVAKTKALIGSYENILLKGFTLSGTSISYNPIEHDQKIKNDATNATTPAGISGAFLNPMSDVGPLEFDAFGSAAIRTYFFPVDKRFPGKLAYVDWGGPLKRMSATFGVSFSKIAYRGEELKPAVGVTPVFALGYDVTRSFSIDVGAILFKQDNPSPLNDGSSVRFAPIISIQFDANLFNRFKSLGSGQSFQLGSL